MKTKLSLLILSFLIVTFSNSCIKDKITSDNEPSSSNPYGVWQRYGSPKGYQTDLAVGNIPGEPENRVYMCEHPNSPTAGLYKGYINGNTISWDASYGLPNAEFKEVGGGERTLYFNVGAVADAGKYKKGVWTNTCGELKKTSKQIYLRWTEDVTCQPISYSQTYNFTDLPSNLTKDQYYGPISEGAVVVIVNYNGSSNTYAIHLQNPPIGYKRLYTNTTWKYNPSVNRCNFTMGSALTYVDQPL